MSAEVVTLLLRILQNKTIDDNEWYLIRLLAESCLRSCRSEALHVLRRVEPVLEELSTGYHVAQPPQDRPPAERPERGQARET